MNQAKLSWSVYKCIPSKISKTAFLHDPVTLVVSPLIKGGLSVFTKKNIWGGGINGHFSWPKFPKTEITKADGQTHGN